MRPIKTAVIGVGHLGKHHARILSQLPGVELVGVSDAVESNCRQVAEQFKVEAFPDYRKLVGRVEAAVLAVPTSLHYRLGMDLLSQGINLLIEKPLAPTLEQADQLVNAAKKAGVVLGVGHVERFNPAMSAASEWMTDPKYIDATRQSGYTFRSTDIGVVLDLMIHDIDLVLSLVKQPVDKVEALGIAIFGKHEDVANVRLTFSGGCVATLSASRASYKPGRVMQIWGPAGYVGLDFTSREATVVEPRPELAERRWDENSLTPADREHLKAHLFEDLLPLKRITPEPCDQLTAELFDFTCAVREQRAPRIDGRQARDAVALAERILAKIEAHAWNGNAQEPRGPLAMPRLDGPHLLAGPHTHVGSPNSETANRQKAG